MRVLLVAEEREKRERKLTVFSRQLERVCEYTTMRFTLHRTSTILFIAPAAIARNNLHHATPQVFNLIFKPRRVGALDTYR